ncbi:hypothetical protein ACFQL0_22135, partial [Haloplanus litoreus]|uniref:hypothetical protein n=1 Tax=Haloplanus litoreus TaxID=767515 RepID=UPI00360F12A9
DRRHRPPLCPPDSRTAGADIRPAVLDDSAAARQDLLFDVVLALTDDPPNKLSPPCSQEGPTTRACYVGGFRP